jgi:D-alanyl-D-alanine carboxypeptidase/D-alanyl-D-alanine-endopeptidase (penicillin-binding protein 4)
VIAVAAFVLAAATPAPASVAAAALHARVQAAVGRAFGGPALRHAIVAIDVRPLTAPRSVYEKNAETSMIPASVLKLATTAAALDAFGPDARWRTTVEAAAAPDTSGRIAGDLYVIGTGDPSLSRELAAHPDFGVFDVLADSLHASGLRVVDGRVIGVDAAFVGERRGHGWGWEDLVWWYGAEAAGLTFADGSAHLKVTPGASAGAPVVVERHPLGDYYRLESSATTCAAGAVAPGLTLDRPLGQNVLRLAGCLPLGTPPQNLFVALEDPVLYAASVFADALRAHGIEVAHGAATAPIPSVEPRRVLASYQGAPLAEILKDVNKPSHNLRAEMLLRLLGAKVKGQGSEDAGTAAVVDFLKAHDVDVSGWDVLDGCGQAPGDLVTARGLVELLAAMSRHPHAAAFRESLPVAGIDGTLAGRLRGARTSGHVEAKTGTLRHTSTLVGYAEARSGETLAFAILVNHATAPVDEVRAAIDAVAAAIAGAP